MNRLKFYLIHVIVLIITLGCLMMNGPMRGGLPVDNSLAQRLQFIGENQGVWTVSWCIWMFAAIGLLTFCAILADELKPSVFRTLGLTLVAIGIAPDLIAEVIYAFVMPKLYAGGSSLEILNALEITAMHLTGFLGNGLYNIGGLLLTLLAIKAGLFRPWLGYFGLLAWLLGIGLSVTIAAGHISLAEIFTALSMVISTLWMLLFAYQVLRR